MNLKVKAFGKKILIFHLLHAACKHLLPTPGSCEKPVRMPRQFKYTMHICICPPDVKCNISISTCTIGWTVILCTSCCAGSCTKLEATKLNPLKRWWALALGGTPGESVGEGRKWPRELHKRSESNSMAPATDKVTPATQQQILLNWQTHVNIIHLYIRAVVCLLHPFPLNLNSTGVLFARISPLGYRGFFHSACSFCARSPPRERRHRMARLGERRMAQGRAPLWLSRGSPRSGEKAARCCICSSQHTLTTEITKAKVISG